MNDSSKRTNVAKMKRDLVRTARATPKLRHDGMKRFGIVAPRGITIQVEQVDRLRRQSKIATAVVVRQAFEVVRPVFFEINEETGAGSRKNKKR